MSRDNSRRSNSSNSRDGGRNKKSGRPTNSSRSTNRPGTGSKFSGPSSGGSRSNGPSSERRSTGRPSAGRSSDSRSYGDNPERGGYNRPSGNRSFENRSSDNRSSDNRPYGGNSERRENNRPSGNRSFENRSSDNRSSDNRPYGGNSERRENNRPSGNRSFENRSSDNRSSDNRPYGGNSERGENNRPSGNRSFENRSSDNRSSDNRPYGGNSERGENRRPSGNRPSRGAGGPRKFGLRKEDREDRFIPKTKGNIEGDRGAVRLNRFIANAGICSRREADDLILAGLVEVNGKVIQEMGYKVMSRDRVRFNGSEIRREKKVYFVLNKPKGFITTTSDPKARKTVMELMSQTGPERIYPVGRLDRQTTGVLLFTNDGDFAKRLTHPSHGARKIYDVTLDKNLDLKDFHAIAAGIELSDGLIKVDNIAYVEDKDRNHVGVVLHSGRNRIVRRIFEHLGYDVVKLDRTVFAGVTKKNLRRGQWRKLSPKEVETLMMQ